MSCLWRRQDEFSVSIPMSPPLVLSPSIEDNFWLRLELKQNIFTGFKIQSAVSLAEAQYQVQDAALQAERGNALYEIRLVYLGLSQALAAERLVKKSLELVRSRRAEVKKMQDQGLATHNDALKAELAVAQAEFEAGDAAANVRLLRAKLNLLIGLPLPTVILPDDFTVLVIARGETEELAEALEKASHHRGEINVALSQVAAGEAGVTAAASGLYPTVVLKGHYTFANPNPAVFPRAAEWNGTWEIGAAVSIDLGAYPQTILRLEEAEHRLRLAQTRHDQVREGISLEVLAARLELERGDERLRTAEKMLQQAAESRRVIGDKHKNGQAVLSDVLDADIALLRAELLRTQARLARESARITFLHKQGLSWQPPMP